MNISNNLINLTAATNTLTYVLSKIFKKTIINADYQTKQLQGGTVGDVRLVSGIAETIDGENLPYKVVWKTQKKWERPGDFSSWRKEYDLYMSDFNNVFSGSLNWAECYHAEINEDETEIQLWIEYIDGVSGENLTIEMLEYAAAELGRFQGKLYKNPGILTNMNFLSEADAIAKDFAQWHNGTFTCDFLCSDNSWTPKHLKEIIKNNYDIWDNTKTVEYNYLRLKECDIPEHLKKMIINIDENKETIFENIKSLPVILSHRDFWITNIFYLDGKIKIIDWDCVGWGYMGEDIASLIYDDTEFAEHLHEYYDRLIPAYYNGISEYMDISPIENFYIKELILIKFGYRTLQGHMFAESDDKKKQAIEILQKIYDLK